MRVTIKIPTALRQFTDGHSESQLEARTVAQALAQLTSTYPELRPHLYRDGSELRNFINVYLNTEDIRHQQRLDTPVKDGDVVTIVPSIAGGATSLEIGTGDSLQGRSSRQSVLC
jgi:MoaD family protein